MEYSGIVEWNCRQDISEDARSAASISGIPIWESTYKNLIFFNDFSIKIKFVG